MFKKLLLLSALLPILGVATTYAQSCKSGDLVVVKDKKAQCSNGCCLCYDGGDPSFERTYTHCEDKKGNEFEMEAE